MMTSEVLSLPHVTTVSISDSSEAAIISSAVQRLNLEILHHKWLLKQSWYFGAMMRQEASDILMAEKEGGVFLVRDSATIQGDYVLCVREDTKVSHYIINKVQQGEQTRYRIGDQIFTDLPALLTFYKSHYLDTTPLVRPAQKRVERVIGRYDFEGSDPDDLPFRKGDILIIVSKDEENWWTARNSQGQTGSIPVPYICRIEETPSSSPTSTVSSSSIQSQTQDSCSKSRRINTQRKLPAYARVKQTRVPNAYDRTALRLEVGDIVKVTKMSMNGQWEGEVGGKIGHFPFTHVEFVDNESGIEEDHS